MEIEKMHLDYRPAFHYFKQQPYVYSYRMRLLMLKYDFTKSLLKTYVNHTLKRTQKEVDKMNGLTIESIMSNPYISRNYFKCLYAICRFLKPNVVVETGVGLGASSSFILQALKDNKFGELYSIDNPRSIYSSDAGIRINESVYTSQDSLLGCLVPDHLRKHWTLVLGKSRDELHPLCKHLGIVDLFFHDSEHTYQNMLEEYETVWPHIRKNGILTSHDIDWNNAFDDFSEKNHCAPRTCQNGFGIIVNCL